MAEGEGLSRAIEFANKNDKGNMKAKLSRINIIVFFIEIITIISLSRVMKLSNPTNLPDPKPDH